MNSYPCGQTLGEILYSNWLTLVIFFNFFFYYKFLHSTDKLLPTKNVGKLEKSEKLSLPIFYAIRVSGIWF